MLILFSEFRRGGEGVLTAGQGPAGEVLGLAVEEVQAVGRTVIAD